MKSSRFAIIALASVSLIGLEIVWTRIFSAEFFYAYAFLTLSLAIMGLGLGALALRLFPAIGKGDASLGIWLSLASIAALVGPPAVLHLGLKFSELYGSMAMVWKLAGAIAILSSTFFFGGVALAKMFRDNHDVMPRLYMSDLIGAGAGALVAIWLMNGLGTLVATFAITLPLIVAALLASPKALKLLPVAALAAMIGLSMQAESLLDIPRPERAPVIYKHWDAMSKVKLYDRGPGYRGINIDNMANSPVYGFDGDWNKPDSELFQFGLAFDYLVDKFDSCTFLALGAGGGSDALQALQWGATEVHAVEVNPHINHMMIHGDSSGYLDSIPILGDTTGARMAQEIVTLNEYTGDIYNDPRVTVVTDDARAYVRKYENKFDLIFSLSSNSWAALASGSFALAENYLFTQEAFEDYWHALSDSGFLAMEHQFYMPRILAEVIDALDKMGVDNPNDRFAIYDFEMGRRKVLLLSKRPLDDSLRYHAFYDLTPDIYDYLHLLYPAHDSVKGNIYERIVNEGWEAVAATAPSNISPCTDNQPFVAQQGLWKNFDIGNLDEVRPYEFMGFPLTKIIILVILLVAVVIVAPLNLIPYFVSKEKLRAVPWLYFFAIGAGFMIVEVVLMQKYALFVGPSAYSIATILVALLVSSGVGSRFADRVSNRIVFGGIIAWIILDNLLFGYVTTALAGLPMLARLLVTAILIAPLGFLMGMPFPKATARVKELIDWGFAVNGAASVVGSTAVILAAMAWGFTAALAIGAGLYLIAYLLLSQENSW